MIMKAKTNLTGVLALKRSHRQHKSFICNALNCGQLEATATVIDYFSICLKQIFSMLALLVQVKRTKPDPRVCSICHEVVGVSAASLSVHIKKQHPDHT